MIIGLGGGCHWCTEAVFQAIKGVIDVRQGYVSAKQRKDRLYEGVLIKYNPDIIALEDILLVHLRTHQSMKDHSMRHKYKSAVYVLDPTKFESTKISLEHAAKQMDSEIVTEVCELAEFSDSRKAIRNYYNSNPERPFCTKYIQPKLDLLQREYAYLL
ncbi:peptide-methionine (S)-S-oxide reductase [Christiangramia portivictoriae]|uniref:peptide-methionine (S)-S-oxide reductase n=1 Tax=Christiangramia portivictoriae TaxID=326069 RepID=UPI000408DC1C|nr:peptide-methionine (S)-S-oxide reductase [Christiangramia portivictoriae]